MGTDGMSTGARWRAEVKAAIAASHRQQRNRRGRRPRGVATVQRAGMVRINPTQPKENP
jgi:hypothetical protein